MRIRYGLEEKVALVIGNVHYLRMIAVSFQEAE
jgi:hypothetical protein